MARILTVCNQKGGVGKTTTVINLSACLAELGRKVLVIDLDPQANCTTGLGIQPSDLTHSVYEVLAQPKKFVIYQVEDVIQHTAWPGLDIVPSHINLAGAELELVNKLGREVLLKKALRPVVNLYDYIILDTPPSLSLLTVNALTAVNEVVISMRAEPWSLDGIENLLETIEIVREDLNPDIRLSGVVVTMLEPRTQMAREIIARLEADDRLRDQLFSTRIRRNVRLAQSADSGQPIIYFDGDCHGAWAYRRLARELLIRQGEAQPDEFPEMNETSGDGDSEPAEARAEETPRPRRYQQPKPQVETQPESSPVHVLEGNAVQEGNGSFGPAENESPFLIHKPMTEEPPANPPSGQDHGAQQDGETPENADSWEDELVGAMKQGGAGRGWPA
jgi:chromosome partitioning protein